MKKKLEDNSQLKLGLNYPQLDIWPDWCGYILAELELSDVVAQAIGFDIETKGLEYYDKNNYVLCISISGCNTAFGMDRAEFKLGLEFFRQMLEREDIMLIGHNIKFDLNFLTYKYGWRVNCLAYDTMLAAYFLNESDKFIRLEELIERYGVMPNYKTSIVRSRIWEMNSKDRLVYNMQDARACALLKADVFDRRLERDGLTGIMNIACQAIPVLSRMETRGILVDTVYAKQQQMKLYKKLLELKLSLKQLSGTTFSPDSPQQLAKVLYGKFNFYPAMTTASGSASTQAEAIIKIRQEQCEDRSDEDIKFIDTLIEYTKLGTLNEKYYNKLSTWIKEDGCVHTSLNLAATDTGRLSSSNPNMQNQKRGSEFRGVYIPKPGYIFIEGDWSQIELRIAAWLAKEDKMIKMFEEGLDIHTATLCEMKGYDYHEIKDLLEHRFDDPEYLPIKNLRVGIKNINFGELYGASSYRLQREMVKNGIYWSIEECERLSDERKKMYPNIVKWKKKIERFIVEKKCAIMPFGQVRRLPYADFKSAEGRQAIRQGVNFIIQSTASAWMPIIGMILLDNYFKTEKIDGHLLLNVHDSILCEVRRYKQSSLDRIKSDIELIMEHTIKDFINETFKLGLNVPLEFKCEYMERWR